MGKSMQKYFMAIVPEGKIQEDALKLKEMVKEKYNAKYALKSPAHVTIKMPFLWNERKEDKLFNLLEPFFKGQQEFPIMIDGFGRFGRRIMYARVEHGEELVELQYSLKEYTRKALKLEEEFTDKAFKAHMTLVYRDLKAQLFDECWELLNSHELKGEMQVSKVALLKKINYRWEIYHWFEF
ncbi:2'-5' RNA ligase family protein [Echinicola jeungdonensis]|uniref:2'-5' RNA ligase family protein n=1 Tax=Echinicola jeungdonensis TaxID=709343 RepID=A0ABV5J6J7_9BACT|nr:2'-5' RNA ligase family protein [Echinicola jeungdonensis]MDN3669283.1 2'-5' RNA ligase family protein [Echinicola jeungdonensis]